MVTFEDRWWASFVDLVKVALLLLVFRIGMLLGGVPLVRIDWLDDHLMYLWDATGAQIVHFAANPRLPRVGGGL